NNLWVPIVEKAYAVYLSTKDNCTYGSLDFSVYPEDAFRALNMAGVQKKDFTDYRTNVTDPTTGTVTWDCEAAGKAMLTEIATCLDQGKAVVLAMYTNTSAMQVQYDHQYTVVGVNRDSSGQVVSATLRNPRGKDMEWGTMDG